MKKSKLNLLGILTAMVFFISFTSCSDDDNDLMVNITVNEGPSGDVGGDFIGNGGSGERTVTWTNNLTTADYNADITASAEGAFLMTVKDANGTVVLERSLTGSVEPDSFSGVTDAGEPGTWSVTITLNAFNGDGSYSLSAGD